MITDIYRSRESPIPGVTSDLILASAKSSGHRNVKHCPDWKEIREHLGGVAAGDVILTIGAGDIYRLAEELVAEEEQRDAG